LLREMKTIGRSRTETELNEAMRTACPAADRVLKAMSQRSATEGPGTSSCGPVASPEVTCSACCRATARNSSGIMHDTQTRKPMMGVQNPRMPFQASGPALKKTMKAPTE
jgi:hypothetical protein